MSPFLVRPTAWSLAAMLVSMAWFTWTGVRW